MSQIPFDKREGKIWYNGQVVEWQDAKLHALTHGLHYGSSIYEGIRVYNYKPFKLKEHMDRLKHSAECLGFELPYSVSELCDNFQEQIRLNDVANGYGRPAAWRGSETMLIGGEGSKIHVVLAVWKSFETKRHELRDKGMKMCISKWRKPNADSSPYSAKCAGIYTLCTIVKNEAVTNGFDDALLLDSKGYITEGTTSNVFFIFGNELHTPLADCFLNGITRQTFIQIAKNNNIKVVERHITLEDAKEADSAFLSGTAIEMTPVKYLEDKKYSLEHPMLAKLLQEYTNLTSLGS
jgi:branched-chain amino acid aminotransferase